MNDRLSEQEQARTILRSAGHAWDIITFFFTLGLLSALRHVLRPKKEHHPAG